MLISFVFYVFDLFNLYVFTSIGDQHDFYNNMMFVSFYSNTTGATCGAGTPYPLGAPEFTQFLVWFLLQLSLVFLCSVLSTIVGLFILFLFTVVLCGLRLHTTSDYTLDLFKVFFHK